MCQENRQPFEETHTSQRDASYVTVKTTVSLDVNVECWCQCRWWIEVCCACPCNRTTVTLRLDCMFTSTIARFRVGFVPIIRFNDEHNDLDPHSNVWALSHSKTCCVCMRKDQNLDSIICARTSLHYLQLHIIRLGTNAFRTNIPLSSMSPLSFPPSDVTNS